MNLFRFILNLKRIKMIKTSRADVVVDAAERKMSRHMATYVHAMCAGVRVCARVYVCT